MGTTGVVALPTKSSWARASAAVVTLLAAVVASHAGVGRSRGDGAGRMRIYADDHVAKGSTSPPSVSGAGPVVADEGTPLMGASMLNRLRLGFNRHKSTVPPAIFVVHYHGCSRGRGDRLLHPPSAPPLAVRRPLPQGPPAE